MRLIDADALIEEMQNAKYKVNDGAYARGAPEEDLANIRKKIEHYTAAAEALRKECDGKCPMKRST